MKQTTTQTTDAHTIAITHYAGGVWRCLAATTRESTPGITDASTMRSADDVQVWLSAHGVSRVINVLPSSATVCRTCTLPDVAPDELDQALELQAEAHLTSTVPEHRQALVVLDPAEGETNRMGLMVGWPETCDCDTPDTVLPVTHAPDIAALAALIGAARPAAPLLWLDRANGSIAFALSHANGVSFRATTEDLSDRVEAGQAVSVQLAETAMNARHSAEFVQEITSQVRSTIESNHDDTLLMLPDEIVKHNAQRLDHASTDPAWWSTYGIAAGVLLAHTDQLGTLTDLVDEAMEESPSLVDATLDRLSSPTFGAGVLVAAVLLLMVGPTVASGIRLSLLKMKYPDIEAQMRALDTTERRDEIYGVLYEDGVSVSKVLGDLANCTPLAANLVSIRIQDRQLSFQGSALPDGGRSGQEVIIELVNNMQSSGVFSNVDPTWGDPNYLGQYEFTVTAEIESPFTIADFDEEQDFSIWTATDRKYGTSFEAAKKRGMPDPDDTALPAADAGTGSTDLPRELATSTSADPRATPIPTASRNTRPHTPSRSAGGRDEPQSSSDMETRGDTATDYAVPPPLTEAELIAMTELEVGQRLNDVARARSRNLDEVTEARLRDEFSMLMDRKRQLRSAALEQASKDD